MTNDLPRIGLGVDMHRLLPGRPCVLGGVKFESEVGPLAHSDGDAVLHAACDAVLGAAGLDDIGTLFEDTDPANENRDSAEFCRETMALVKQRSLKVWSMDIVLETERPKLKPMRQAMRERIAELFEIDVDRVNVKGKTGEKVDAVGRGEACRATVVALLGSAS
ncbi:MAG TPA: 2-C-methyl-D-erythritol 2,4-cyclodiphosphate synthase [Planctomycetes bacterium]|jgi:2-C-methyl-D-erythritol 2,4-cyclodiphosphate synthase|nr:2-C-methyl-D-erythritol 2,4-cyclodiphosphate synthase [Planctomycetota bacterium]